MNQAIIDRVSEELKKHFHANKVIGKYANRGYFWEITRVERRSHVWIPFIEANYDDLSELVQRIIAKVEG